MDAFNKTEKSEEITGMWKSNAGDELVVYDSGFADLNGMRYSCTVGARAITLHPITGESAIIMPISARGRVSYQRRWMKPTYALTIESCKQMVEDMSKVLDPSVMAEIEEIAAIAESMKNSDDPHVKAFQEASVKLRKQSKEFLNSFSEFLVSTNKILK